MKKVLAMVAFVMVSVIIYAFNDKAETNQGKKEVTDNGEVVVMNKEKVFLFFMYYHSTSLWRLGLF